MTMTAPKTAEDAAEALYAAGELSPESDLLTKNMRDVAVTTAPGPHAPRGAVLPPNEHGLPAPPELGIPGWALTKPERDEAQAALFPKETKEADGFWRWLMATRRTCAQRARRGYFYLAAQRRPEGEDVALYRQLLRWVAWCDGALWLLRAWYAPHDAAPRPEGLLLPFAGLVDAAGRGPVLVRELHGLAGETLLEDVLAWWHQLSLSTGYLEPLDEAGDGDEGQTA